VLFPAFPFLYAHFKAVEWRWWLSGIRFGEVRLNSTLRPSALYGLYWKVIGWFFLLSIGSGIYFALCGFVAKRLSGASLAQIATSQAAVKVDIPLIVMMGLGYIALILSLNVVMRLYLLRDQWARVLASVRVYGIEAVADITAKGDLASALGEGFADGLDVAGF